MPPGAGTCRQTVPQTIHAERDQCENGGGRLSRSWAGGFCRRPVVRVSTGWERLTAAQTGTRRPPLGVTLCPSLAGRLPPATRRLSSAVSVRRLQSAVCTLQ